METTKIEADITRVRELRVSGKNADALAEEVGEAIDALRGRGSVAVRKTLHEALDAARTAEPPVADVAPMTYKSFAGVEDLVTLGAARVANGVNLHQRASDTARDVAAILLDIWLRLPAPNVDGPDILGDSHYAREASRAMYAKAGEGYEDTPEARTAAKALVRAIQYRRDGARTDLLKSIDTNAQVRERFAGILAGRPADSAQAPSEFVAQAYNTSTLSAREKKAARYRAMNVIPEEPNAAAVFIVERLARQLEAATPERVALVSDAAVRQRLRDEIDELDARLAEIREALDDEAAGASA